MTLHTASADLAVSTDFDTSSINYKGKPFANLRSKALFAITPNYIWGGLSEFETTAITDFVVGTGVSIDLSKLDLDFPAGTNINFSMPEGFFKDAGGNEMNLPAQNSLFSFKTPLETNSQAFSEVVLSKSQVNYIGGQPFPYYYYASATMSGSKSNAIWDPGSSITAVTSNNTYANYIIDNKSVVDLTTSNYTQSNAIWNQEIDFVYGSFAARSSYSDTRLPVTGFLRTGVIETVPNTATAVCEPEKFHGIVNESLVVTSEVPLVYGIRPRLFTAEFGGEFSTAQTGHKITDTGFDISSEATFEIGYIGFPFQFETDHPYYNNGSRPSIDTILDYNGTYYQIDVLFKDAQGNNAGVAFSTSSYSGISNAQYEPWPNNAMGGNSHIVDSDNRFRRIRYVPNKYRNASHTVSQISQFNSNYSEWAGVKPWINEDYSMYAFASKSNPSYINNGKPNVKILWHKMEEYNEYNDIDDFQVITLPNTDVGESSSWGKILFTGTYSFVAEINFETYSEIRIFDNKNNNNYQEYYVHTNRQLGNTKGISQRYYPLLETNGNQGLYRFDNHQKQIEINRTDVQIGNDFYYFEENGNVEIYSNKTNNYIQTIENVELLAHAPTTYSFLQYDNLAVFDRANDNILVYRTRDFVTS